MTVKKKLEQIQEIPLSQITVKYEWNGRYLGGGDSPGWTVDSGDDSSDVNDFSLLKTSIADRGQDTPVTVRPKGQRFELVCGFRRYRAIEELAKDRGDKDPTIKAIVREYDDLEARLANASENTERDGYRPADLCWTVGQTMLEYAKKRVKVTQQALAPHFGVNQSYLAKMWGICSDLDPRILDDWRAQSRAIAFTKVYEISRLARNEQQKAWNELKAAQASSGNSGGSTDPVESLCKKAEKAGGQVGALVLAELLLPPAGEDLDSDSVVECLITFPKGKKALTIPQKRKVVKAFKAAYETALAVEETEQSETEE